MIYCCNSSLASGCCFSRAELKRPRNGEEKSCDRKCCVIIGHTIGPTATQQVPQNPPLVSINLGANLDCTAGGHCGGRQPVLRPLVLTALQPGTSEQRNTCFTGLFRCTNPLAKLCFMYFVKKYIKQSFGQQQWTSSQQALWYISQLILHRTGMG